jgi:hypothetical protein
MDDRQERILRMALGAVYDGDYPDLRMVDAEIGAPFTDAQPVEARRRVIDLIIDAIAERGEFARSTPSPSSPAEPPIAVEGRKVRKIMLDD